jgi:uncharacterized membrane protein YoaK (UPF0700 family)
VDWLLVRSLAAQVRSFVSREPAGIGAPRVRLFENDRLGSAALSGVAGYVDAAGLLALLGHLPAHLTGELVNAAADVSTDDRGVKFVVRMVLIVTFIAAVAMTAIAARIVRRRGEPPLPSLLMILAAALTIFCFLGWAFAPQAGVQPTAGFRLLLSGGGAVLAMGVQNALMREAMGTSCPTTVMTGNLTQFIIEIVELASARFGATTEAESVTRLKQSNARLQKVGISLACFLGGAFLGAWLTHRIGLLSISLPALGVSALALIAHREVVVVEKAK